MRNKSKLIIALFLSFLIIFSNISFVFAEDEVINTEEPQIEQVEKTETEEVKIEKVEEIKNIEETKTEEVITEPIVKEPIVEESIPEEPKEEKIQVSYPIKITWHIKYRDVNGEWTEFTSSTISTLKNNTTTVKPSFSALQNKVVKGDLYNAAEDTTYVFNSKYVDNFGNSYVTLSKAIAAGEDYEGSADVKIYTKQSIDVYFTAQYREKKTVHNLTGIYSDKIGHTSGSWGTINNTATISYTHTFKDAADVPSNYRFVYWKNYEDNDIVNAGEKRTWDLTAIPHDVEFTYKATYQPIITINYYSEDGTFLGSTTNESINIYESGKKFQTEGKFLGWYEDGNLIPQETIRKLELTTEEVQTDFDVYAKYEPIPKPVIDNPTPDKPTPSKPEPKTPQSQPQIQPTEDIIIATTNPPTTTINPAPTPKAGPEGSWALINLIATILACICALALLFVRKDTEDDEPTDEEKKDMRKILATKIASILVGIISVIAFILTEDMSLPMVLTDKWTFLMILLLIIEIVNIFIIRRQSKGEEDDDNN